MSLIDPTTAVSRSITESERKREQAAMMEAVAEMHKREIRQLSIQVEDLIRNAQLLRDEARQMESM